MPSFCRESPLVLPFRQLQPTNWGCPICNNGLWKLAFFASAKLAAVNKLHSQNGQVCSDVCVERPATSTVAWHKRPCYGFCQAGALRKRFVLFGGCLVVGRCHRRVFSVPPNPLAVGGALRGAQRLSVVSVVFLFGAFPLRSSGRVLFSASGNLLSAGAFEKITRQHYDVFGSGRGTSTLNLQSGLLWPRGASEGAPFQSFLAHIGKTFLFSGTEALSPASRG
jgi:hypothetical protein